MADLESSSLNALQSRKGTREDQTTTTDVILSLGIASVDMDARSLKLNEECVQTATEDERCNCIVLSLTQRGKLAKAESGTCYPEKLDIYGH